MVASRWLFLNNLYYDARIHEHQVYLRLQTHSRDVQNLLLSAATGVTRTRLKFMFACTLRIVYISMMLLVFDSVGLTLTLRSPN